MDKVNAALLFVILLSFFMPHSFTCSLVTQQEQRSITPASCPATAPASTSPPVAPGEKQPCQLVIGVCLTLLTGAALLFLFGVMLESEVLLAVSAIVIAALGCILAIAVAVARASP